MNATAIPDGYKADANGRLVPIDQIREIDIARDDLVNELVEGALKAQAAMRSFKQRTFEDIAAFIELSSERYDINVGGKKGNVTLYSYDGQYKIQRAISEHVQFDEGIQAAKALILECLDDWSEGANANLRILVDRAFEVDRDGNLSTNRILGLRRVKIDDSRWLRAMDAISDSLQIVGSKSYIRFYKRVGVSDRYEAIPLDIAGV